MLWPYRAPISANFGDPSQKILVPWTDHKSRTKLPRVKRIIGKIEDKLTDIK